MAQKITHNYYFHYHLCYNDGPMEISIFQDLCDNGGPTEIAVVQGSVGLTVMDLGEWNVISCVFNI